MHYPVTAALILLFLAPFSAQSEASLTVTGNGEVRVKPDMATLRLGAVNRSPTARGAQEGVNQTVTDIVEAAEANGIERDRIQTSQLTLQPVYSDRRSGETPTIIAYTASYTVAIRVDDLDKVGPVVDGCLGAGANRLDGLSFGVAEDTRYRLQALQAAMKDARRKAEVMAEAEDLKILSVLEISEGTVTLRSSGGGRQALMAMEAAPPTPILQGEVTVSGQVTVRYQLGPR